MLKFIKAFALVAMMTLGLATLFAERAADQDGRINGSILDFDGKPWANLPLKIKSEQGVVQEGKTDEKGQINFSGLKNGKYVLTILAPQLQTPFEVTVGVSGSDTPAVNVNFKDILEKQNPEAAAAYKKRAEEQSKVTGMK